ncbi:MAG: hypothetical protein JO186_00570 [Actinobacteria bacterium]|nr:hypothetical protein [Actinomycetota bacterium]MBV8396477.1 hypothetical protein [Actinomycetota bacterium]MBV8599662.1 hypothetical protein [Actinomycetota bacterium]
MAPAAAGGVTVTLSDRGAQLSTSTVPVGAVVFRVVNRGKRAQAFAIAGRSTRAIAPGKSASLSLDFATPTTYRGSFGTLTVYALASPATTTTAAPPATVVRQPCANPTATTVKVSIFDFGFTLSQNTVPCGPVTFQITNTGAIQHNVDFQIPFNGVVGWAGGLGLLGGESQTETLNYTLTGPYTYQCDLHWIQGQMIGTLTVTQG